MAFALPKPAEPCIDGKRKRPDSHTHQPNDEDDELTTSKRAKHGGIWSSLDLILSFQSRDLALQRKIELAFDFVKSSSSSEADSRDRAPGPISVPRLASFLIDWIQPILISPDPSKKTLGFSHPCLDFRCWDILEFSLQKSPDGISLSLLRSVTSVLQHATQRQDDVSILFERVLGCLSLLLSTNARAFYNVGVELWVSCATETVHLLRQILSNGGNDEVLVSLSSLLLEQFSSFLRFHPNPKKIFPVFVDRLLEVLLELLVLLHLQADGSKCGKVGSLLRIVEDVMSNGLFHPVHVSGYFNLRSSSAKQEATEVEKINKSYHRHFFKKLEKIIVEKKAAALGGFGYLPRLFVPKAKGGKGSPKGTNSNNFEQVQQASKPLFEIFMHFMEPLLLECKKLAEKEFVDQGDATEFRMIDCMLKSINEILLSFIREKIYTRLEDTSEGVHFSFLKEVYEMIVSIGGKMYMFWISTLAKADGVAKVLPLIGREVIVAVRYFLEIEYKVLGEDLVKVWQLMFYYLVASLPSEAEKLSSLLTSEILNLGCRLIRVYSELRQVNLPIFAMCRAVRLFETSGDAGTVGSSLKTLVCSQEFQLSISNAIKSIPEGQASRCIQHMNADISDSLEWMRVSSIDLQAELLGRILSEIYVILLDSVTVTATNSVLIGNSIKNLIGTIRPSFTNLVQDQSGAVDELFSSVTGVKVSNHEMTSMSWVLVFFFRMYISCISLYRESISLMPPSSSRKAAASMGSLFIMSCGMGWMERPDSMDEGYFSWIEKPSISLPDVIKSLSDVLLSRRSAGYAPLVYVIHLMALQRLCDLNRQIKFLERWDPQRVHMRVLDLADNQEANGKVKELRRVVRKEAKELVNFMVEYLEVLPSDRQQEAWDLGVCSLNEASLPTSLWWLLCQNTDVWCVHASNKSLKKFLSHLFHHLLPCGSTSSDLGEESMSGALCQRVTMQHISLTFLSDSIPYEQTVIYKHFASKFNKILNESLSPILLHACMDKIDLGSLPDWSDMLRICEKGPTIDMGSVPAMGHSISASDLLLSNIHYSKQSERQSLPSSVGLRTCENLLSFLCKMREVFVGQESITRYTIYVINIERLIVYNLSSYQAQSSILDPYDLLNLFCSCRRVLKHMVMTLVEGKTGDKPSSFFSDVFNSPSSLLWLLKSLSEIVGLPHELFPGQNSSHLKEIIFPLIGHTSSIFFMMSKFAMSGSSESSDSWNYVDLVAETLREETRHLMGTLWNSFQGTKLVTSTTFLNWNKLSSVLSCLQGFLWGLALGLDDISKLNDCIIIFEDFLNLCSNILLTDLEGSLLQGLLRGESPHIAFAIRELFMASAAMLNLKVKFHQVELRSSSIGVLLGASHRILLEMVEMEGRPDPFCFVWMDGILKYLEVVGSNISYTDPNLSKDVYPLLINTHLRAIGKCISLQEKASSPYSHENGLNTFKTRFRMSFTKLICRPGKFYLKTVIHALERALVDKISTGDGDGGSISPVVAAGIDCMDLILESVSGQRHILEKSIPSLVDAIFNIILHLRNPTIFYQKKVLHGECDAKLDAGSVIFMCIEVLTKVARSKVAKKHLFDMHPWHISQCLHVPVALFQNFNRLGASMESVHQCIVDRQFSANLYDSCCRLLCNILKHQTRKVERCIALLQVSVRTLVNCLEIVNADFVSKKGYFSWELQDAINCASSLRRIYEEIRQQKVVFGRFSYYFLSSYVSIYSGCGPLRTGIKREVDEALRPGVYSLIDICTPDDLQQLHTTLGEGPCRSTLATLLNDYRLNFQYEGKV